MDETAQCEFCGAETKRLATMQCDNCWEVSTRLKYMPLDVIESILASVRVEFLQQQRQRAYNRGAKDERSRASVVPGRGDMGG